MSNLLLILITLSWIVAALALAWLYRKQATWPVVVLVLLFCGLGAYSAAASFLRWQMGVEREAARHLVGVTVLDFDSLLGFLQKTLSHELDQDGTAEKNPETTIDWSWTFEMTHRQIQQRLDAVTQNAFIQRYYAVHVADVAVCKQQLEYHAAALAKLTEKRPKRLTFDAYVQQVEDLQKSLGKLESRIGFGIHDEPLR